METLFLDGNNYTQPHELHAALKMLLSLPDYYGENMDALHDCLSERLIPLNLYVNSFGNGDVARAMHILCQIVEDLGGTAKTPE